MADKSFDYESREHVQMSAYATPTKGDSPAEDTYSISQEIRIGSHIVVGRTILGAVDQDALSKMVTVVRDHDERAFQTLVLRGQLVPLTEGVQVTVLGRSADGNAVRPRVKGSPDEIWMLRTSLERAR
jgi:hypothetical protein